MIRSRTESFCITIYILNLNLESVFEENLRSEFGGMKLRTSLLYKSS